MSRPLIVYLDARSLKSREPLLLELLQSRLPDVTHEDFCDTFASCTLKPFNVTKELTGTAILVGGDVRFTLELPRCLIHPIPWHGLITRQIPASRVFYANDTNRLLVALLLEELYLEANPTLDPRHRLQSERRSDDRGVCA